MAQSLHSHCSRPGPDGSELSGQGHAAPSIPRRVKWKRAAFKQRISGHGSHWSTFYHGNKQGRGACRGRGRLGRSSATGTWLGSTSCWCFLPVCTRALLHAGTSRADVCSEHACSDPVNTIPRLFTVLFLGWPASQPAFRCVLFRPSAPTIPVRCPLFPLEQNLFFVSGPAREC